MNKELTEALTNGMVTILIFSNFSLPTVRVHTFTLENYLESLQE